jgi:hypothetical protein
MRRSSLLALAAAALAFAAPAAAQVPGDSVVGAGTARFFTPDLAGLTVPFSIDVRSGPNGESPVGSMQLLIFFDEPTCLAIRPGGGQVADEAAINFRNTLTGGRVVARITGGTSGSRIIGLSGASSPADCDFVPPVSAAELIEGGISIVDAPALPSSKEQCKQGGWRAFGVFRNQGDCITFVSGAGKPAP